MDQWFSLQLSSIRRLDQSSARHIIICTSLRHGACTPTCFIRICHWHESKFVRLCQNAPKRRTRYAQSFLSSTVCLIQCVNHNIFFFNTLDVSTKKQLTITKVNRQKEDFKKKCHEDDYANLCGRGTFELWHNFQL